MRWDEIKLQGSHELPITDLSQDACRRLVSIKCDDTDTLISLRLKGKVRIYGIKQGGHVVVLWWDPEHRVCPSQKKHT